jgi:hypothetical protein
MKQYEKTAMQAAARATLNQLIPDLQIYGPKNSPHFAGIGFKTPDLSPPVKNTMEGFIDRVTSIVWANPPAGYDQYLSDVRVLADCGYRILIQLAKKEIPADSDLDVLTEALNSYTAPIRYLGLEKPERPPYRRNERGGRVVIAQLLLDYMNTTARYGVVHDVCIQCGSLMLWGRRGRKKFCSEKCRKERWVYDQNKQYYNTRRAVSKKRASAKRKKKNTGGASSGS